MIEFSRDIDFNKYRTFFLQYMKDDNVFSSHYVRPSTATYEEITDRSKFRSYTLDGYVLAFKHETSLAEILIECAIFGISVDFIEIMVPSNSGIWNSERKIAQVIDLHKEDITKYIEKIEAKRHYVALNKNKKDSLKFLVVDRFSQKDDVDFLNGKYDKSGIIAGFKNHNESVSYCGNMNNDIV